MVAAVACTPAARADPNGFTGYGWGANVENGVVTASNINPAWGSLFGAVLGVPFGKSLAELSNSRSEANAAAARAAIAANFDYNDLTDAESGPGMGVSGANNEASHAERWK